MKKIYTYIMVIVFVLVSITSCVIDNGHYYEQKSRATVVCERTVDVIQDYMIFVDMALMFNEYLKTENDYKPLVLASAMKEWTVVAVEGNWSVTLQGRQYIIYPDSKPIDEVGSVWRVTRVHINYHPAGGSETHDLCYIRCSSENNYEVELEGIITRGLYGEDSYSSGPVDMTVKRVPQNDRFTLIYSVGTSGEFSVLDFYGGSSSVGTVINRRVIVKYTFEGECKKFDYGNMMKPVFTYGEAEIKAGKAEAAESEIDDIKLTFSNIGGSYYPSMTITLNGERVDY